MNVGNNGTKTMYMQHIDAVTDGVNNATSGLSSIDGLIALTLDLTEALLAATEVRWI